MKESRYTEADHRDTFVFAGNISHPRFSALNRNCTIESNGDNFP